MQRSKTRTIAVAAGLILSGLTAPLAAQSSNNPDLYKAYFLENQAHDYAAALELYREVLGASAAAEVKRVARAGAERCRDAIAAKDFSKLMPGDCLAYVEFNRPGQFFEKLAAMVGLTTTDMQLLLSQRPSRDSQQMAYVPNRIAISPALFQHLTAFGGAAAAITEFDPEGDRPPSGVLVVHHGDATLLKGLLETAFQFSPTAEKVRDLPTFGAQLPDVGRLTGVLTESLFIVGTGRELVTGVVERLLGERNDSLADRKDLAEIATQRTGSTLFAYCNLQSLVQRLTKDMAEHDRHELKIVDGMIDLDSLRWAAFSFGIHENVLGLQLAVRLADDHRCIAYNLTRLPPMTRQCLAKVPGDAAAVFGLGLNPALTMAAADAAKGQAPQTAVTGLDIFREFFGNVREICGFVVPGEPAPNEVPNGCILMAVNDVARSRALWDQFLSIPGIVGGDEPIEPRGMKIGSTDVTAYAIPDFGKVYLAEIDGCIAIGTTRGALKSAIRASGRGESIIDDAMMGKALAQLPKDTSVMALAHLGRCAAAAGSHAGRSEEGMQAQMAAQLCSKTIATFAMGQAPSQLTIRANITGLPDVNDVLKNFSPMINAFIPRIPSGGDSEKVVTKESRVTGVEAAPGERP